MTIKRENVLPIGQAIDFGGHTLFVEKLLNSGYTGEVYQGILSTPEHGDIKVAIKAMKALDLPMALKLFGEECLTLGLMMGYEEEAKKQGFLFKIAPVYYGKGEFEKIPFFVMEFIAGKEIPNLLEERASLPEFQALTVAWHLYHTLEMMHSKLKKTYIDLKFENLWWVEDSQTGLGQLKLTDFGTLENIPDIDTKLRGIKRDVLLGTVFLCKMLTGYTPHYSLGDLLDPPGHIRQMLDQADISWGSRWLLRRLLHSNPDIRPPLTEEISNHANVADLRLRKVADIVEELEVLVGFWSQSPENLLRIGQANLDRAEALNNEQPLEARKRAERARMALDILRLRSPERMLDFQDALKRTEDLLALTSHLRTGQALFNGRSYNHARKYFAQGLNWSDEPAVLRRWAYLSRIGEDISSEIFDSHKEQLIEVVKQLNEAKWQFALQRLQTIKSTLGFSIGLECLEKDGLLFQALSSAYEWKKDESYGKAAKSYREALELLTHFPQDELIPPPKAEVGDLLQMAEEMEHVANTREKAKQQLEEARQLLLSDLLPELGDQRVLIKKVEDALNLDRFNPSNFKKVDSLIKLAIERFEFGLAIKLAELASTVPSTEVTTTLQLARQLYVAETARVGSEFDLFIQILSDIWGSFSEDSLTRPAIYHCLKKAKVSSEKTQNNSTLRKLAGFASEIGDQYYADELTKISWQQLDEVSALLASQELGDQAALIKKVQKAFDLDDFNINNVEKVNSLAKLAIKRFEFGLATQLAELALTVPRTEITATLQLARQLYAAETARMGSEFDLFIQILSDIWGNFSEDSLTRPAIYHCLDKAKESSVIAQDSNNLRKLADFARGVLDNQHYATELDKVIKDIQAKETQKQQQVVENLIVAANWLLALDTLDHLSEPVVAVVNWPAGRYQQYFDNRQKSLADALQLINDAQAIDQQIGQNKSKQISELKTKIEKALDKYQQDEQNNRAIQLEKHQKLHDMIQEKWKKLSAWHEQWEKRPSENIHSELQEALLAFIYHCYMYLAIAKDDSIGADAREWARQASEWLTTYGEDPWAELKREAEEHIKRVVEKIDQAQAAFTSGNLDEATALIDRFSLSIKSQKLKGQINQVRSWQEWQKNNKLKLEGGELSEPLLIEMRQYVRLALPEIYWRDSMAANYLTKVQKTVQEKIRQQIRNFQSNQFITDIRLWLRIEWLLVHIPKEKPAMGEQKPLNNLNQGGLHGRTH